MEIGIAWEKPLTERPDVIDNRLTAATIDGYRHDNRGHRHGFWSCRARCHSVERPSYAELPYLRVR